MTLNGSPLLPPSSTTKNHLRKSPHHLLLPFLISTPFRTLTPLFLLLSALSLITLLLLRIDDPPSNPPASSLSSSLLLLSKLQWLTHLPTRERQIYSQNGEDGILEYIFDNLGPTNKFYVEFGTENATECNTRYLHTHHGWDGLLLDGKGQTNDSRIIRNHFITAENILELFGRYDVPKGLDLLSVDVDGNDFWIAKKILEEGGFEPRVVVCEYNRNWRMEESFTLGYNATRMWDGHPFFGVSALGWTRGMDAWGYHPVYIDKKGINMFFVRRSVVVEWLKGFGIEVGEEVVKEVLPGFETVYRRSEMLFVGSREEFEERRKRERFYRIEEGGAVLIKQARKVKCIHKLEIQIQVTREFNIQKKKQARQ
ncbi:hypothetical protein HDV05_005709 [Chytridiales sp. JEL 0842]|nr:hypothetical protein HDV05_005709 [Chytridiales sp. JEL 0842]